MRRVKPKYITWIRKKKIITFALLCILATFGLIFIDVFLIRIILLIVFLVTAYISFILICSFFYFSDNGGGYQNKIHEKIASKICLENTNTVLDIGAGSGALSIKIAKMDRNIIIKAIDYWGADWEYSKSLCESNAKIENVNQQIEFTKASASKLPFQDCSFDAVVSCLTFHEVKDTSDKNKVIDEALRVLKSGGQFVFFDLFNDQTMFNNYKDLIANIESNHAYIGETSNISQLIPNAPIIFKHKKVLGNGILIVGVKK